MNRHTLRNRKTRLRPNIIRVLPKLISVNPQLRSIVCNTSINRRIAKIKSQWNIIVPRQIQVERSLVESYTRLTDSCLWISRSPITVRRVRLCKALTFGVETSLIQGATSLVDVLLAAEVTG